MEARARYAAQASLANLESFAGEAPCLCHGDVHRRNVLIAPNGRVILLDWEAVRYRVAAADFNQTRVDWLCPATDATTVAAYADRTGRDAGVFATQVAILRLLWHLRTYNFEVRVRRGARNVHAHHLEAVVGQCAEIQARS